MDIKRIIESIKKYFLLIVIGCIIGAAFLWAYFSHFSFEDFIIQLWDNYLEDWGYLILFVWTLIEGELGLVFAGLAVHDQKMNFFAAVFIAGIGASLADQLYFFLGRFNRRSIQERLSSQRRKFALANKLLQKYGWSIIFLQRFMYGMRTILPMSIGATRYPAIKFGIINLISSWIWAFIAIAITWYFGEEIVIILDSLAEHPYIFIGIAIAFIGMLWWIFNTQARKKERK